MRHYVLQTTLLISCCSNKLPHTQLCHQNCIRTPCPVCKFCHLLLNVCIALNCFNTHRNDQYIQLWPNHWVCLLIKLKYNQSFTPPNEHKYSPNTNSLPHTHAQTHGGNEIRWETNDYKFSEAQSSWFVVIKYQVVKLNKVLISL